jgi:hypothetical protein
VERGGGEGGGGIVLFYQTVLRHTQQTINLNILCIIILTYSVVLNQVHNGSHNGMCQQGFEYSSLNYIQIFIPTVM